MKRSKGDTFGVQSFTLACGRGISAFTLPRDRSRVTESVRYPSPSSHSVPYFVSLACPRGIPGDAPPRNRLRATFPGWFPSPLDYLMPCSVSFAESHDSPGIELSRNRLRATESGHFSSPLHRSTAYSVSFVCFHGTRPSIPLCAFTAPARPLPCASSRRSPIRPLACSPHDAKSTRGAINSSADSL